MEDASGGAQESGRPERWISRRDCTVWRDGGLRLSSSKQNWMGIKSDKSAAAWKWDTRTSANTESNHTGEKEELSLSCSKKTHRLTKMRMGSVMNLLVISRIS